MSLHYILDGYNIIHQISGLNTGSLEEQRHKLIRHIENNQPQGSRNNQVTVVFDGRSDVYSESQPSSVKVLFSQDESADDKIKRIVVQADSKANTIVVTNDRAIQYHVRAVGAKAVSVEDFFFDKNKKLKSTASKPVTKEHKNISKTVEFKITSELEKIWLKNKNQK